VHPYRACEVPRLVAYYFGNSGGSESRGANSAYTVESGFKRILSPTSGSISLTQGPRMISSDGLEPGTCRHELFERQHLRESRS
jgi:hypothetical protein